MRDLLKRLDRLEGQAPTAGVLRLISWIAPKDNAQARKAKRGRDVLERTGGESESEFLARVSAAWRPASGVSLAWLERA
jgi:hypothetical protein